jgi:hypothetical protein
MFDAGRISPILIPYKFPSVVSHSDISLSPISCYPKFSYLIKSHMIMTRLYPHFPYMLFVLQNHHVISMCHIDLSKSIGWHKPLCKISLNVHLLYCRNSGSGMLMWADFMM